MWPVLDLVLKYFVFRIYSLPRQRSAKQAGAVQSGTISNSGMVIKALKITSTIRPT